MGHILCVTTGLTGILDATLELARRLEAAGHRVTCASPWAEPREVVLRQGLTFLKLPPVSFDPAPRPPAGNAPARVWRAWRTAPERRRAGIAALGMDAFGETLQVHRPDLALVDGELPEFVLTARARQVRVCMLSPHASFWKRPGLPPVGTLLTPDARRVAIETAWLRLRARRAREIAQGVAATGATDRRSLLLTYARRLGVPWDELEVTSWLPPFRLRRLPMLQMTAPEIDFPHDPPPNVRFVGPMVAADRREQALDPADEVRLEAAFSDASQLGQKLIYCSLSSKDPGDASFLQRLAQAVSTRPDWRLVVALGGTLRASELALDAPNVHAFSWLPQLRILRRAHCALSHGGIHSIHESLHFRVPMAVYSGGRYDQNGCAARVGYHGLGLVGDKDRHGPDEIRRTLERVLEEPGFRERVNAVQTAVETYRERRVLEQTVERLLAQRGTSC